MNQTAWLARPIRWSSTGDPLVPYRAQVDDRLLELRLGDFPAEHLYTLLVDGAEAVSFSTWPEWWTRPIP
jgi:hypothetical protein